MDSCPWQRIAEQDVLIRQLSERLAICSELLSKAAERHDNAERLRQRIAELEEDAESRLNAHGGCKSCGWIPGQ